MGDLECCSRDAWETSEEGLLPRLLKGYSRKTLDKGIRSVLSHLKMIKLGEGSLVLSGVNQGVVRCYSLVDGHGCGCDAGFGSAAVAMAVA